MNQKHIVCACLAFAGAAAQAYTANGQASTGLYGSVTKTESYGPVESESNALAHPEIDGSVSQNDHINSLNAYATSSSQGYVSGHGFMNMSDLGHVNPFGTAHWDGSFVNDTGKTGEFFLYLDARRTTDAITVIKPYGVHRDHPGNSAGSIVRTHTFTLGIDGVEQAITVTRNGLQTFSVGVLSPGDAVQLSLDIYAGLDVTPGQQYICRQVAAGPEECELQPYRIYGWASASMSVVGIWMPSEIPEPSAAWLMAGGALRIAFTRRRSAVAAASDRVHRAQLAQHG